MEAQQAQLQQLFENFGFDADTAKGMSASFLSPEDGKTPELPFKDIHEKVLSYAKPHLKSTFTKELSGNFKGQYTGEFINKVIALSDGQLSRKDFERLNDEDDNAMRALEALIAAKGGSGKKVDESEIAKKYNDLVKQMTEKESEYTQNLQKVHDEYGQKENQRHIYDHTLSILSGLEKPKDGKPGQKISVDHTRAAQTLLRELGDRAILKYDPTSKQVGVYSKEEPDVVYMHDGKQAKFEDLLQSGLKENNWIQQSNGGGAGNALKNILGGNQGNNNNNNNQQGAGAKSSFRESLEQHIPSNAA